MNSARLQIQNDPYPVLYTPRLVLRAPVPTDAAVLAMLRSNPEINKWLERPETCSESEALAFIEKIIAGIAQNDRLYWLICDRETGVVMGTICFWNIVHERYQAEIGYDLHPDFQKKGIMQESIDAVLNYGFRNIGFHKIIAFPARPNIPSVNVLRRNHFVQDTEGIYALDDEEKAIFDIHFLEKSHWMTKNLSKITPYK